jgi:lipase
MATLHVSTFGPPDGRPVLALHGVTAHSGRWRVLADALPELRLSAADLRGHGHSPWLPPWHLEQHVADALGVLDELGPDPVVVFGHSFGGAVAVHLARAARDRVAKLVLLDPAIGLDPADMLAAAEQARADESYPDRAAAWADRAARWPGIPDELVDAELEAHLMPDGERWRYRYCQSAVVSAWSEMARPALTPPSDLDTLLLPAARADYVRPEWVEVCRGELGARLQVTEIDAGHVVYLERTGEVAERIRAFLRSPAPGA